LICSGNRDGSAAALKGVARDQRGGLVMLAAAGTGRRQRGHHVRADCANQADEVARDLVLAPFLEGLIDAEGVAEIDRPGEVLLGAVEAMNRGELLGAEHAERLEDFWTDFRSVRRCRASPSPAPCDSPCRD